MPQTTQTTTSRSPSPQGRRRGRARVLVIGTVVVAAVAGAWLLLSGPNAEELTKQAQRELRRGEYEQALQLASEAYHAGASNTRALIAAEAAQKLNQPEVALEWYRKLRESADSEFVQGAAACALLCVESGRLAEAGTWFEQALAHEPNSVEINRWYAQLLNLTGRRWEASQCLFVVVREGTLTGRITMEDLLMMANFEQPFASDPQAIELALKAVPDDPLPLLGTVAVDYESNRPEAALRNAQRVLTAHPQLLQAHAAVGRGLLETQQLAAFAKWQSGLPAAADDFPEIWMLRGRFAMRTEQPRAAARCFWEAVRREPDYPSANYQLGLSLSSLEEREAAQLFLDRYEYLADYLQTAHPVYHYGPRGDSLTKLMRVSGKLGRFREQLAWSMFLGRFLQTADPNDERLREAITVQRELESRLSDLSPDRTATAFQPAADVDLSSYPLPEWSVSADPTPETTDVTSSIRFRNIAAQVGLNFTYFNGAEGRTTAMRILETTGGGVAAIDFDLDGWSDLYFTQGNTWPPSQDNLRDRLFRSLVGESILDVTDASGLGDTRYSQGVNFGDVNGDGFPDLYVGNAGVNQLYLNNGDGTFASVTLPGDPGRWTTSVLIADLDGDGHADLFDANYLSGDDVYDRLCGEGHSVCPPDTFDPEQSDVYLNNGDGSWFSAAGSTGLADVPGKALGLLAADFDNTGRLAVMVADDGIANRFFVSEGTGRDLRLRNAAIERGLAFGNDGRGQACMGIAAGDYNADGRLDLFITNYYEDSNTLYTTPDGELFEDLSRPANLRDGSFWFLGFGTQFLDANLDGHPDLVIANGHVDDRSASGIPFRMRPQCYQNLGGRFVEVPPPADAEYMNQEQLGRGLARIDFDRDGKCDFAVSHLDTPAALVQNVTPEVGGYLRVRLTAVGSHRDAIGTRVTLETEGSQRTMQLVAGDGFHAGNERVLLFGLAEATRVERCTVHWPSGVQQTFRNLKAGQDIHVVEGQPGFFSEPR